VQLPAGDGLGNRFTSYCTIGKRVIFSYWSDDGYLESREQMNHILVAEILVEDATLREVEEKLRVAKEAGDAEAIAKAETLWLKHSNLRNLILCEMDRTEIALYEMQREHIQNGRLSQAFMPGVQTQI
jgi:hypothetical protein